ncbi:MAG: hypothetical protein EXS67_05670 [Candidatus Margulisbacteria bacterium]|nr:hypothetical protein [Candidatus Margulisiibacteriota bacterium]
MKGFFLVELLIVASITLLFMTVVMVSGGVLYRHMSVSMANYEWFHRLYAFRMEALSRDEDITLTFSTASLPEGMAFSGAKTLGFKSNGDTKYAGTLVLSQAGSSASLTMPVGYGQVVVQDATRF